LSNAKPEEDVADAPSLPVKEEEDATIAAQQVQQATDVLVEEDEEQRQEAYTEISDAAYEDPFVVLNDTPEIYEDEPIGEADDATAEEMPEQEAPEATEVTAITSTVEQGTQDAPSFADGTQPYKVVEKVVTETVKEIYKEAPANTETRSGNDAVMEKLVDLLDYEIRSRRELELAEAAKNQDAENTGAKPANAVPTFAASAMPDDEDDDDTDDEDDEAEDVSANSDSDDDRDDEV
jgi:hypothetical protein